MKTPGVVIAIVAWVALAGGCGSSGGGTGGRQTCPVPNPGPSGAGKIVFVSSQGGLAVRNVFIMNRDGSGATNLTKSAIEEDLCRFSFDGKLIIFRRSSDQIWIIGADGSNPVLVTPAWPGPHQTTIFSPSFSPDGAQILFINTSTLKIMNRDGTNVRSLTASSVNPTSATFSPDGSTIVFAGTSGTQKGIFAMNPDGSNIRLLTQGPGTGLNYSLIDVGPDGPRFSHDGSTIAYYSQIYDVSTTTETKNIYVMKADGTQSTQITTDGDSKVPAYTGDGHIVFLSGRTKTDEIYIMSADGSNQAQLTHTTGTNTNDDPDGQ